MGIGLIWQNNVLIELQDSGLVVVPIAYDRYNLLLCNDAVVISLIPLENDYNPGELVALQTIYQQKRINLVQLWEDIWYTRREQVIGRIKSLLGLNKRLHGRKGLIKAITQKQADDFLNDNHIQGSAKAKYRFALDIGIQTVAVASFSNARFMKRISADYQSVELIRFATLMGFTVTGGFTKLLKHFVNLTAPNDVMSYADRDWSLGNAYEQSGFTLTEITPPAQIWLQKEEMTRVFPHRLPLSIQQNLNLNKESIASADLNEEYLPVFNTGNLKYILYL
ncbi:hypothetical protein [Pedobacter nyackensis]|uniref:hypothetical protein n=1 Tax=Pedobacter nyackensis TaxID=475255 RepID=UPI00292D3931|nr:hypothetical protein [Pedobacter nyackensis]